MSTRCQLEFYDSNEDAARGLVGEFGEPAARIYKHSDGYPSGILPMLKDLQKRLGGKDSRLKKFPYPSDLPSSQGKTVFDYAKMYGARLDDPEWAAAEFITMFRGPMSGNIYVSHQIHSDIEYLYRIVCKREGFEIHVFRPEHDEKYDIKGWKEMTPKEIKSAA